MPRKLLNLFLLITFLSLSSVSQAFKVPNLSGPVIDEPSLLSPNTKNQLDNYIRQIHDNNGPQVQVYVASTLQGEEIESVAIQIFDQWKLGDQKKDNGILFIIAPNEKKMRIEVGQGLEGDIPDVIAKRIIADVVSPYFKRGEFDLGVLQGVSAISQYLNATPDQKVVARQQSEKSGRSLGLLGFILHQPLIFLFLLIFILRLFFGGRGGGGGFFLGGGGFGGGSGGGSWGGGGGSSSGGGSSGSW